MRFWTLDKEAQKILIFENIPNLVSYVRCYFIIDHERKDNFWKACSKVYLWYHPETGFTTLESSVTSETGHLVFIIELLALGDVLMFEIILIWKKRSTVCPGVRRRWKPRKPWGVPHHDDGRALRGNPGLQYPHLHGPVHTPDNNRWDTPAV